MIVFNPRNPRQKEQIGFAGADYQYLSGTVDAQTCVNWYPVTAGPKEEAKLTLHPTPGTNLVRSVGSGPHRGAIEHKGNAYFLSGNTLIKMDTGENFSSMTGTTTTTGGQVCMASNGYFGNQVIIVDGSSGYTFDGAALSAIADADFPSNPTSVDYMDGRAIVTKANSGIWYISDLNDFTAWTATQITNAERDRDNLVRVICNARDIMLLGDYSTEIATNTNASPFPFEVYPNGIIDVGCAARFSAAKADGFVYWLTQDRRGSRQIVKAKGLTLQVVSNQALEYQLSTYATISDAEAFTYTEHGTTFYQITFPSAGVTWVLNTSVTDPNYAWFRKVTNFDRHIASTFLYFNGKQYVGAWNSSNVYSFSSTKYTDDGTAIIRERTSHPIFSSTRNRLRHYKLELIFEAGVGLISGQGSDPQVALDWSDDSGKTWSNVRTKSIGQLGAYGQRVVFDALGISRNRIYRIKVSDPIKWVLVDGYLDVEELAH